jgi:MerR family glutamine synthetase transcriptional repressor
LAGIKQIFASRQATNQEPTEKVEKVVKQQLSDEELRKLLRAELIQAGRFNRASLRQGDIARFFH